VLSSVEKFWRPYTTRKAQVGQSHKKPRCSCSLCPPRSNFSRPTQHGFVIKWDSPQELTLVCSYRERSQSVRPVPTTLTRESPLFFPACDDSGQMVSSNTSLQRVKDLPMRTQHVGYSALGRCFLLNVQGNPCISDEGSAGLGRVRNRPSWGRRQLFRRSWKLLFQTDELLHGLEETRRPLQHCAHKPARKPKGCLEYPDRLQVCSSS
jgi:hypothetical protein